MMTNISIFLFSDVPFDPNTTGKLLCVEWHIPVELRVKIDRRICDIKDHRTLPTVVLHQTFEIENELFLLSLFVLNAWLRLNCQKFSVMIGWNTFKDKLLKITGYWMLKNFNMWASRIPYKFASKNWFVHVLMLIVGFPPRMP